jgi:hypothetical protein
VGNRTSPASASPLVVPLSSAYLPRTTTSPKPRDVASATACTTCRPRYVLTRVPFIDSSTSGTAALMSKRSVTP